MAGGEPPFVSMKLIVALSSATFLLALGIFSYTPLSDQVAAAIVARDPLLRHCEALIAAAYHFEPDEADFTTTVTDLNADGRSEYLVQAKHPTTCGTTGCIYEICSQQAGGAIAHLRFGFSGTALSILDTFSEGMRDLKINNSTELHWDGKRYTPDL